MSKSVEKRLAAQGATLLGCPKDTLLRAMEICPVRVDDGLLQITEDDIWIINWLGGHGVREPYQARDHLEHAFRERLEARDCQITSDSELTVVKNVDHDETWVEIAADTHHLSALAEAIVKIGGKA